MDLTIESAFSPAAVVGHLSYFLLVVSMLMNSMRTLRLVAIASGFCGLYYDIFILRDPVGTFWESAFVGANLLQMALMSYRNRTARMNDAESLFCQNALPQLEPALSRKLLRTATTATAARGDVLIEEGEQVQRMIFLTSGHVDIVQDGHVITRCGTASLLGEFGAMTGEPAMATVVAGSDVEFLSFEAKPLRKFLTENPQIRAAFETGLIASVRQKVSQANTAVIAAQRGAQDAGRKRKRAGSRKTR
ncbi:MAG: cyclic nucleotide-binding domain-containing protein [Rhodobiaceae bacterium]|nr:cyclic nucleotide-binding domain-containing protein [Rhodobiaceae bacterium]MCC0017317.1 cyclic nucleotide-binding domain-containing protein [Rhodobiaceae bacterium]MCC0041093.1 cyclic nucleotide-binding domain-containing protein [Rhodobiaceae bacterium]